MVASAKPLYVCALRMKSGELMGVRELATDVADRITPRFIVPPQSERDSELEPRLIVGERFPDVSRALAGHWPQRDALIEATYLLDEFGRDRMGLWLPKMFENARKANARPIPLVAVDDLLRDDLNGYRACIDTAAPLKFGVVFSSGESSCLSAWVPAQMRFWCLAEFRLHSRVVLLLCCCGVSRFRSAPA